MKLFEIASPEDTLSILSVIKGLADKEDIPSELPFGTFKQLIKGDEIGLGTPQALVAFKNQVDPSGDVISKIDDTDRNNVKVILNTEVKGPEQQQAEPTNTGKGPSVDSMASSAAAKAINSKI